MPTRYPASRATDAQREVGRAMQHPSSVRSSAGRAEAPDASTARGRRRAPVGDLEAIGRRARQLGRSSSSVSTAVARAATGRRQPRRRRAHALGQPGPGRSACAAAPCAEDDRRQLWPCRATAVVQDVPADAPARASPPRSQTSWRRAVSPRCGSRTSERAAAAEADGHRAADSRGGRSAPGSAATPVVEPVDTMPHRRSPAEHRGPRTP